MIPWSLVLSTTVRAATLPIPPAPPLQLTYRWNFRNLKTDASLVDQISGYRLTTTIPQIEFSDRGVVLDGNHIFDFGSKWEIGGPIAMVFTLTWGNHLGTPFKCYGEIQLKNLGTDDLRWQTRGHVDVEGIDLEKEYTLTVYAINRTLTGYLDDTPYETTFTHGVDPVVAERHCTIGHGFTGLLTGLSIYTALATRGVGATFPGTRQYDWFFANAGSQSVPDVFNRLGFNAMISASAIRTAEGVDVTDPAGNIDLPILQIGGSGQALTFAFIVKPTGTGTLFSCKDEDGNHAVVLSIDTATTLHLQIDSQNFTIEGVSFVNKWSHVAFAVNTTYVPGTWTVYVNDTKWGDTSLLGNYTTLVPRPKCFLGDTFHGEIRSFTIYGGTMTQLEAANISATAFPNGRFPAIRLYKWNFTKYDAGNAQGLNHYMDPELTGDMTCPPAPVTYPTDWDGWQILYYQYGTHPGQKQVCSHKSVNCVRGEACTEPKHYSGSYNPKPGNANGCYFVHDSDDGNCGLGCTTGDECPFTSECHKPGKHGFSGIWTHAVCMFTGRGYVLFPEGIGTIEPPSDIVAAFVLAWYPQPYSGVTLPRKNCLSCSGENVCVVGDPNCGNYIELRFQDTNNDRHASNVQLGESMTLDMQVTVDSTKLGPNGMMIFDCAHPVDTLQDRIYLSVGTDLCSCPTGTISTIWSVSRGYQHAELCSCIEDTVFDSRMHLAVTVYETTMKLYVNGQKHASTTDGFEPHPMDRICYIGRQVNTQDPSYLTGSIASFSIWSGEMTDDEVYAAFSHCSEDPPAPAPAPAGTDGSGDMSAATVVAVVAAAFTVAAAVALSVIVAVAAVRVTRRRKQL